MEAVSVIVSALINGAAAAASDTAAKELKDAYARLKGLVRHRFRHVPSADVALSEAEKDPQTCEKPLTKAVAEVGLDKDTEIVQLARQVLDLAKLRPGKYNINIGEGAKGVVIGDHSDVTQHFGDQS